MRCLVQFAPLQHPFSIRFSRRMAVTSPGVGFTNPGLGFTTRRVENTNRRLGRTTRRLRKTTRRLVRATSPTMPMVWICPFLRARVYAYDFLKKLFTPSHGACFLLIFIVFACESLRFQVFTRLWTLVNTWKRKPSHLIHLKIRGKEPSCERVNAFLRF